MIRGQLSGKLLAIFFGVGGISPTMMMDFFFHLDRGRM